METSKPAKRKRPSAESTNTNISSIFDDNSPLSSSESLMSNTHDKESEWEAESSHDQPEPSSGARGTPVTFSWDLYGTAASQRPQRKVTSQPQYPGFYLETRDESVRSPSIQDTRKVKSEQAFTCDVTSQLPQKQTKKSLVWRILQSEPEEAPAVVNDEQNSASSSRKLRKRRAETSAPAAVQRIPNKKAKTMPNKTGGKTKPKPKPAKIKDTAFAFGRVTRAINKSQTSTATTLGIEATLQGKSETVVLKVPVPFLTKLELSRRPSLSPESVEREIQLSDASASQVSALFTPDMNTSFESASNHSSKDSQEQCAQLTLAPVLVSSQALASVASSQAAYSTYPVFLHSQEGEEDCDLNVVSPIRLTPPSRVLSRDDDRIARCSTLDLTPQQQSLDSTQPTLLLHQPWNAPSPTPLPLPELSSVQIGLDVISNATTEDEEELDAFLDSTAPSEDQNQLHLQNIAEQLFANRRQGMAKPAPVGQPEVWADGRQELCETLHYFRSYQSACYCTGGFVRGFMFDKVAHARDYIDSNVVISRAGGGLIKDKDSGEMKRSRDQSDDTTVVQGLKNCMKHYNPVVIITGLDNPHIPSQPPHQYCVLDYFKPTHVWIEKSGNSKILRYRFEKLNAEKESWWRPADESEPIELGALESPLERACRCCRVLSTQIYLNGWMCLQPSCAAFWHIVDTSRLGPYNISYEPDEASLIYDPRFLKQKTSWPNDNSEYLLSSKVPEISHYSVAGEDNSKIFWSGIVCPDCGRCNSRLSWTGWLCANPACSFKKEPPHSLIPAATLGDPFWPLTTSYTLSRDIHAPLIDVSVSFAYGYRINRYNVPGLHGFIAHMIANKTVLEESGGPDAMFEELQRTDIGLRRRPMPNGQLKGESYCRHFTVNYGMPYKFIAATASHSFEKAARPITATRRRLNWAAKHLLAQESGKSMAEIAQDWKDKEFNEVLALGYFESQKINYHDDGEVGLGPTIATLSLGAPGTMRIRMKTRHYNGSSTAGIYDDACPLPGCQQFDARAALQPSLDALKASDPKAYRARLKQIPKELKLKTSGNAKDVLRMELGHGDVVVMHGAEIQKYYEHAVEHAGKLRFALTCRYIDPESLKEEDRAGYIVGPDDGEYDGSKLG